MTDQNLPHLSRSQIIKLDRLLYMKYRPSEIAEIIGVHADTVRRSYLMAGCPYERDERGHIWIVGTEFKDWAREIIAQRKKKPTSPMKADEAWCMKCNKRVQLINPKPVKVNRYLELLQSKCPDCGTTVNRARKRQE